MNENTSPLVENTNDLTPGERVAFARVGYDEMPYIYLGVVAENHSPGDDPHYGRVRVIPDVKALLHNHETYLVVSVDALVRLG